MIEEKKKIETSFQRRLGLSHAQVTVRYRNPASFGPEPQITSSHVLHNPDESRYIASDIGRVGYDSLGCCTMPTHGLTSTAEQTNEQTRFTPDTPQTIYTLPILFTQPYIQPASTNPSS